MLSLRGLVCNGLGSIAVEAVIYRFCFKLPYRLTSSNAKHFHASPLSSTGKTYASGWKEMEGLLFCYWVTGQADAQFLEDLLVYFAEHHRAMHLTAF